MKICELCKKAATIYCDSDQASLCWACDAKVHSANFLVARHSRSLLCHVCHSVTSWSATGSKLGPTLSVCESCLHGEEGEESSGEKLDDDDEEEEEEEEDGDVADEENQVVPWFTTPDSPPPPPASSSSSSSEESSNGQPVLSRKRMRYKVIDHWYNVGSENISGRNVRTPPMLTEETAVESGRGLDEDETVVDSSSKSTGNLKARRIETGRIDRVEESNK